MAPPPKQQQMRPSRYLFALAAIFIVLYGIVFLTEDGPLSNRLKPRLGLDLVGGTTLTLVAQTEDGGPPSPASLEQARNIIENRVNAFGVAEAEVVTEGTNHIVISVPSGNNEFVDQVGATAKLRFRKVLRGTPDELTATSPAPDPSAAPTAEPSPAATSDPSATESLATESPATESPATESPATTSPASEPAATSEPAVPSAPGTRVLPKREDVLAKLGSAATVASGIEEQMAADVNWKPSWIDDETRAELEPFAQLTPDEIAVLPPTMQYVVPQITCDKLNARLPGSIEKMDEQAVACEGGAYKYLLDVAKVEGTDISSATANIHPNTGAWVVDLVFSGSGTQKWTDLTKEAYDNSDSACTPDVQGSASGGGGGTGMACRVAVVLDNEIISSPTIQGVLGQTSQITGDFDKKSATLLANQIKYGALPLSFTQGDLQTITATLGADYLRAGLLAMGIGMLLVIIYSFFYYRLLGSVIMLSLVLSALLTFGMLVALGRGIGFTLTLAGIAGFIVSLGVAADSFVIYFERLKDEIREGRNPRNAIQRAWVRARRTIITANAVTILAAVVLYILGVGSVRGFAFALGLATALDLVIVFLFRHPMMTLLARTPAFLSPRVSGLGRVLEHSRPRAAGSGSARTKEV